MVGIVPFTHVSRSHTLLGPPHYTAHSLAALVFSYAGPATHLMAKS